MTNITQNNISSTTGLTAALMSTVLSTQQVHADYRRQIIKIYGSDYIDGLNEWLAQYGSNSARASVDFRHEEQGRLQEPLIVTSTIIPNAAGAESPTITFTNPVVYNSANHSPVAVGWQVEFPGGVTGTITSIPAEDGITVTPNSETDVVVAVAGDNIMYYPANNVVEGSCATTGHVTIPPKEFTGKMQQLRLTDLVTDQALASFGKDVTFFDFYDPSTDSSTSCWTNAWLGQREVQFKNAMEGLTLTGKAKQTSLQATYGTGFSGVIPTIQSAGNTINYNGGANFQLANLEAMTIQMEKNNAPMEYMLWGGVEFNLQFTKLIKDYFPNGAVTYGAFGSQESAIEWGFTSVGYNGRTFHSKKMPIFNNPAFLGAPGFNYIGNAIVMPAESTVDGGGNSVKYVERVHLENASCGNSMQYDFSVVDGTGMVVPGFSRPTDCRNARFTWFTQTGIEVFAAKQLYYLKRN